MVKIGDVLQNSGVVPNMVPVGEQVMVHFNEYVRPHGRQINHYIPLPIAHSDKAKAVFDAGYVFEIEQLTTGHWSLTITHPVHCDLSSRLAPTADSIMAKFEEMLTAFDFETAASMVKSYEDEES